MKTEVVVIIPVYNAFNVSRDCLASVVCHTDSSVKIVVLDDASPDGQFLDYFQNNSKIATLASERLAFKRFVRNGGYVRSVNFGMRYAEQIFKLNNYYVDLLNVDLPTGQADLILLNSDTLVTPNWLENLQKAAYSRPKIASVTPYTNNGRLASFPRFEAENNVPADITLDQYANLITDFASRKYPELPTSIGFCNYIPRQAINQLGVYNEDAFGLGNGEENDYSMRAQAAGYSNILDDATFVYHIGEQSFADRKQKCSSSNLEILKQMYPHYLDQVSKFCSKDPYKPQRLKTLDGIIETLTVDQPRVLHILHNGPSLQRGENLGGTELHVQDLINQIKSCSHWSLVARSNCYYLSAHVEGLEREFIIKKTKNNLHSILKSELFSLVHVHHTQWFERDELLSALSEHGNYIYAVHDFNLVCPRNHFLTPEKKLCNTRECVRSCGISRFEINRYRHQARELSTRAKSLVCFSDSSSAMIEDVIGLRFSNWVKIRHGVNTLSSIHTESSKGREFQTFKILLLGEIAEHKGLSILIELIKSCQEVAGVKIEWELLGALVPDQELAGLCKHGTYLRSELANKIAALKPDLFLMLSKCPETYSLTLDEALASGVPAMVSNLGAPAERVREYGVGWVLKDLNAETIRESIAKIVLEPRLYQQILQNLQNLKIFTAAQESQYYLELYGQVLNFDDLVRAKSVSDVVKCFNKMEILRIPEQNQVWIVIGKFSNRLIHVLDKFGLRHKVQNLVFRILPNSWLYRVKAARVS